MISNIGTQQRLVPLPSADGGMMLRPMGLDFGAIMLVGAGAGVNLCLLASLLPIAEAALILQDDQVRDDLDPDSD